MRLPLSFACGLLAFVASPGLFAAEIEPAPTPQLAPAPTSATSCSSCRTSPSATPAAKPTPCSTCGCASGCQHGLGLGLSIPHPIHAYKAWYDSWTYQENLRPYANPYECCFYGRSLSNYALVTKPVGVPAPGKAVLPPPTPVK